MLTTFLHVLRKNVLVILSPSCFAYITGVTACTDSDQLLSEFAGFFGTGMCGFYVGVFRFVLLTRQYVVRVGIVAVSACPLILSFRLCFVCLYLWLSLARIPLLVSCFAPSLSYLQLHVRQVVCSTVFFFFPCTLLLSSFWTSRGHRSSLLPPGSCLQFLSRIGFSNPTARRFSSSVANSRPRAFRRSICAQEAPTNLYEYALGGIQTHETDLYQARG